MRKDLFIPFMNSERRVIEKKQIMESAEGYDVNN